MQLLAGFSLALLIAFLAYRAHSLSRSGAFAAVLVGTVIFGVGGWQWAVLLLTFFISSSGLTRAFKQRKRGLSEKFSKGGQRDAGQVLGNGGLAAAAAAALSAFAALPRSLRGCTTFFQPRPGCGWPSPPRWRLLMPIPGLPNWGSSIPIRPG